MFCWVGLPSWPAYMVLDSAATRVLKALPKSSENVKVAAEILVWLEHWLRLAALLTPAERPSETEATMGSELAIGRVAAPLIEINELTAVAPPPASACAFTRTLVMRKTRES